MRRKQVARSPSLDVAIYEGENVVSFSGIGKCKAYTQLTELPYDGVMNTEPPESMAQRPRSLSPLWSCLACQTHDGRAGVMTPRARVSPPTTSSGEQSLRDEHCRRADD